MGLGARGLGGGERGEAKLGEDSREPSPKDIVAAVASYPFCETKRQEQHRAETTATGGGWLPTCLGVAP